jgi:hypothetical protein
MKCNDFEACMIDLLNGSMEEPEHQEALEHALACHKCELLLYEQQRLNLELKTLAAGELSGQAPLELEKRLTAAFRDHSKMVGAPYPVFFAALQRFFSGDKKWKYATAVVSLALCIFVSWNWLKRPQPDPVDRISMSTDVEPVKPPLINQPPELAAVESSKLPVIRPIRPRSRISPAPARVEWITAEVATDFYSIPYVEPFRPNDRVRVVRIQVPYSALADFGLPVYSDQALRPVLADVMVGDDNLARAIRFIEQWRLPREQSHPLAKEVVN